MIDAIRKVDAVNAHTHIRAYTRVRSSHVERTLFHLLCARKLPVLRDLWRGCPLRCRTASTRSSSSSSSTSSNSVLRRSFTARHSPYAESAPVPTRRGYAPSLHLRLSRFLFASPRAFSPRPPADASHTARCARLSMRRAAHASRLRTPVPTDAARGALTSPSATRKSGRNTGLDKAPRPAR